MYNYDWFVLYGRNQHNIVKIKNIYIKKKKLSTVLKYLKIFKNLNNLALPVFSWKFVYFKKISNLQKSWKENTMSNHLDSPNDQVMFNQTPEIVKEGKHGMFCSPWNHSRTRLSNWTTTTKYIRTHRIQLTQCFKGNLYP